MKIHFTILPSSDDDDYFEVYTAHLTMADGQEAAVSATEEDVSYDAFRAEVLEELITALAEASNIPVEILTEDYSVEGYEMDFDRDDFNYEDYADCRTDGC